MSQATLEERVEALEQEVAILKKALLEGGKIRDWRSTFGMFADDPGMEEVHRLGQEYRQQDRERTGSGPAI